MTSPSLKLKNIPFEALFHHEGLKKIDQLFLNYLKEQAPHDHDKLIRYRSLKINTVGENIASSETENPVSSDLCNPIALSEWLIQLAVFLDDFLIDLFDIEAAAALQQAQTLAQNPIAAFKKFFVLRQAKKNLLKAATYPSFKILNQWLSDEIRQAPLKSADPELATALLANFYLSEPEQYAEQIEKLTQWCVQALVSEEGKNITQGWTSFDIPKRINLNELVPTIVNQNDSLNRLKAPANELYLRDGFKLTDPGMDIRKAQDQVNYCIYCHDHEGDFCSKGFPAKKNEPSLGFKKNALNLTLTGCPLEEKISEMNFLKRDGITIGALAMVMVDNPMCPATGHRICNDCMKACIYQKQEPVNIPQIETRVLKDVLNLPWGVEIYDLLTRWNPLRQTQWIMKPYNGLKVLIAGMGPAGFTLAHHLLQEGFAVVGFDGLKIEPLPDKFLKEPIYSYEKLKESLDERLILGFGGVAEYGITVRWDKNFLKLIYISLARRPYFQVFGGVRFGGTITVDDAWHLGFDHFVMAVGAGLPKALSIPGSLAPGMRQANDFLMTLQLGNAASDSSLTNLQIRLPAVVIGGGLTGVDTATEVQAYYIRQVEKTVARYQKLISIYGEQLIVDSLDALSKEILQEYIEHARAIKEERNRAKAANEPPNFIKLIHAWGGVTIIYRRIMQESPAYLYNHEELQKALDEGVFYLSALEPASVELDQLGHVKALICHRRVEDTNKEWSATPETLTIPARAIFVATGTQPNIAYEFEHRGTFTRMGLHYQHYEQESTGELSVAHGVQHCKEDHFGAFTSYKKDDHRVSLIGDTHPVFHGSVVKAMASGLRAYPKILTVLQNKLGKLGDEHEYQQFASAIADKFVARIMTIEHHTENTLELVIKAPLAAKHFKPGQFYRLQNYETFAPSIENTKLQMEPLALIGAGANASEGTLNFMVIKNGASSKLCTILKENECVSLMGPTGVRAKVASEHETLLIVGNPMSIPLLLSYGPALRHAGNKVIYLGLFNNKTDIYCQEKIEDAADVIIWCLPNDSLSSNDSGARARNNVRPQDFLYHSNCVDGLIQYDQLRCAASTPKIPKNSAEKLEPQPSSAYVPLADVDRIYVVGDTALLRAFQHARETIFKDIFVKNPKVFGSVHSTMQCMLKGVCAQCLQWQIDPESGKRTKAVFACSWQDQPLELIDFNHLDERKIQNRLQEKLSEWWVDYLLRGHVSSST